MFTMIDNTHIKEMDGKSYFISVGIAFYQNDDKYSFEELYKHHGKKSLGYKKDDVASPGDMSVYYPQEEIYKYGVVALEFKLI